MSKDKSLEEQGMQDSASGQIDNMKGKVKDGIGGLTGDSSLQAEGKIDQLKGKVKDSVGKAEQKLGRDD